MEYIPLSALRVGHQEQCIRVRASRVWLHRDGGDSGNIIARRMVLVDEEGDSIYAIIPHRLAASRIHVLAESAVYNLGLFQVSEQQHPTSPVDNALFITFTEFTVVDLVCDPNDLFPEWTYRLTSFTDLPSPSTNPRRFIDVIGVIRGISNVATLHLNGGNSPGTRRHVLLSDNSDNEIRVTLWGEAAFRFNGRVIRFLGQAESAVVIFVATTVHLYEGHKELAGASPCRWYINEDIPDINILRASLQSSFQPIAQLPAPRDMSLRSPVNVVCPVTDLSVIMNQGLLENQNRPFRCIVQVWRLTPGQRWWFVSCAQCARATTPAASSCTQPDRYRCSDTACTCTDASLEYRVHLLGSDGTGEAEFTLLGKVAQDLIGASPQQVVLNNCPSDVPITNLALAAIRICHTPPEVAAVASRGYKFLIYVAANSFRGPWASFNVVAVEDCYPLG